MYRIDFIKKTQEYFANKYKKQISQNDLTEIIDCMTEAAIYALKTDGRLMIRDVLQANVKDAFSRRIYDFNTGEMGVGNCKRSVNVKVGKRITKAVN